MATQFKVSVGLIKTYPVINKHSPNRFRGLMIVPMSERLKDEPIA